MAESGRITSELEGGAYELIEEHVPNGHAVYMAWIASKVKKGYKRPEA